MVLVVVLKLLRPGNRKSFAMRMAYYTAKELPCKSPFLLDHTATKLLSRELQLDYLKSFSLLNRYCLSKRIGFSTKQLKPNFPILLDGAALVQMYLLHLTVR